MADKKPMGQVTRQKYEVLFRNKIEPVIAALRAKAEIIHRDEIAKAVKSLLNPEVLKELGGLIVIMKTRMNAMDKTLGLEDGTLFAQFGNTTFPMKRKPNSLVDVDSLTETIVQKFQNGRWDYSRNRRGEYRYNMVPPDVISDIVKGGIHGTVTKQADELQAELDKMVEKIWFADAPEIVAELFESLKARVDKIIV